MTVDIELEFALETNGTRKPLGRAIIKDIPPEDFGPYEPETFAANGDSFGYWMMQVFCARGKLCVMGRIVPPPCDIEVLGPDDDVA